MDARIRSSLLPLEIQNRPWAKPSAPSPRLSQSHQLLPASPPERRRSNCTPARWFGFRGAGKVRTTPWAPVAVNHTDLDEWAASLGGSSRLYWCSHPLHGHLFGLLALFRALVLDFRRCQDRQRLHHGHLEINLVLVLVLVLVLMLVDKARWGTVALSRVPVEREGKQVYRRTWSFRTHADGMRSWWVSLQWAVLLYSFISVVITATPRVK